MGQFLARLGFLAVSVLTFYVGWTLASFIFLLCATHGYYRVCAISRNIWCGVLPHFFWSNNKPHDYKNYFSYFRLRLSCGLRFLFMRETLSDISEQDSFQVSFSDFFSANNESNNSDLQYSHLYGEWKEGNSNEWKVSK